MHQLIHGLLENLEKWFRIKADPECGDDEWSEAQQFAGIQVMQFFILRVGDLPEKDSLIEPEEICGGQHDARHRPGSPLPVLEERSLQNAEFPDEAVEQRQSHRREEHDHGDAWHRRA